MKYFTLVLCSFFLFPGAAMASEIQHVLSGGFFFLMLPVLLFLFCYIIFPLWYWRKGHKILKYMIYVTAGLSILIGFSFLTGGRGNDLEVGVFFSLSGLLLFLMPSARKRKELRNQLVIRRVEMSEAEALAQIGRQTFFETFAEQNNPEDMQQYLDSTFNTEKIAQEFANPQSQHYFAVFKDAVIAYLKLNTGTAQTEKHSAKSMEIERIYVLKSYVGQGVGQSLLDKAMELGKEQSCTSIWLGVWEHNERAINFYKKNQFEVFDKHVFMLGEDAQTDLLMRRKLV